MRKKILIITAGVLPVPGFQGAVETLITNFIEENEKTPRFDITIISIEGSQHDKEYKNCNIIEIHRNFILRKIIYIKIILFKLLGRQTFVNEYFNYVVRRKVKKIQDAYDYIVIENNMDLLLKLKNHLTDKYFYHIHNDDVNRTYNEDYLKKVEICFRKIKKVIAVSEFIRKRITETVEIENIVCLHNCIDINKFKKYKTKYDPNAAVKVYYIGRLVEEKGINKLISAFEFIPSDENISLNIIANIEGVYSVYYQKLLNQLQKQKLKCNFMGYISNDSINEILTTDNSILIVPTNTVEEAYSIVVLEGVASGVPVIVSDSGSLPMTLPAYAGIVIARNECFEENLAKAILKVKDEYGKWQSQITANRETFIEEYSAKKYFDQYTHILKEE